MVEKSHQLNLRAKSLGIMFQPFLNNGKYFFIRRIGLCFLFSSLLRVVAHIAEWRFPRVEPLVNFLAHAIAAPLLSDRVVVLGCARKNGFDELFCGLVADRLGYGVKRCAVVQKNFSYSKVVFGISRKAINPQNNESMDLPFPLSAKFQRRQEFFPVVQAQVLRRFSFFPEDFDDLNIPLFAILAAEVFLEFERGAFHLLVA